MKIVIDLTALADHLSGMERYAMCTTDELLLQHSEEAEFILIFKNQIHPAFKKYTDHMRVEMKVLRGRNKLWFSQVTLPAFLYSIKADVYLFPAFPPPLLFNRKGIVSVFFDMVCWDCPDTMKKRAEIYFKLSLAHASRVSNKVITISEFSRRRIENHFPDLCGKVVLAYCGVAKCWHEPMDRIDERFAEIREKYHLPSQYFLSVSTLEPRKNLSFLLEAYKELLQEKKIDIPLVLAGRCGWKTEDILKNMDPDHQDRIMATGFIDDEDLVGIYRMAECFLYPSFYEGFGLPPLEAFVSGTPVLVADIPVMKEVLGDAVLYFENNDKQKLKEMIVKCSENSPVPVSTERIQYMCRKYSWDETARTIWNSVNTIKDIL